MRDGLAGGAWSESDANYNFRKKENPVIFLNSTIICLLVNPKLTMYNIERYFRNFCISIIKKNLCEMSLFLSDNVIALRNDAELHCPWIIPQNFDKHWLPYYFFFFFFSFYVSGKPYRKHVKIHLQKIHVLWIFFN